MGFPRPRLPKPPESGRRRQAKAYEGAFEAVAAVIIAALLGYGADARLGSTPWGLLVGVAIGFAAMVLRLFRLGRELELVDAPRAGTPGERETGEEAGASDGSDDGPGPPR